MLGKSGRQDAVNSGLKLEESYNYCAADFDYGFYTLNSVYKDSEVFDHVNIIELPVPWLIKYGISKAMSYNQWLDFFRSLSYRIDVIQEPNVIYAPIYEREQLQAKILATAPDGSLSFKVKFETNILSDFPPLDTPHSFSRMEVASTRNKKASPR